MQTTTDNSQLTYTQASAELEEIVKKMQDPECSIDDLAAYTKKAKELLTICKQKLTATDEEVKKILAELGQSN